MDEVCRLLPKSQIERITERYVVGSPEDCVEKLQEYVDIGVDLILLRLHQVAQTSFVREKKHLEQVSLIYNEIFSRLEES
jgi:alkanesulfonate monooxygenase SsuD/methylene tetrahydromethanopterin reductase-like flavin-dependent oxidoreductase (luciferase family)